MLLIKKIISRNNGHKLLFLNIKFEENSGHFPWMIIIYTSVEGGEGNPTVVRWIYSYRIVKVEEEEGQWGHKAAVINVGG